MDIPFSRSSIDSVARIWSIARLTKCAAPLINLSVAQHLTKSDAILTTVVYDDAYFLFSRRLTSYLWRHLSNVI